MEEDAEGAFILVTNHKSPTPIQSTLAAKAHRFGLIFNKAASRADLTKNRVDILAVLQAIAQVDPAVIFLAHDNDSHRPIRLDKLAKSNSQDYSALMDIVIQDWGRPSDQKGKFSFSFYIASDSITSDLCLLKDSPALMAVAFRTAMSPVSTTRWSAEIPTTPRPITNWD